MSSNPPHIRELEYISQPTPYTGVGVLHIPTLAQLKGRVGVLPLLCIVFACIVSVSFFHPFKGWSILLVYYQ